MAYEIEKRALFTSQAEFDRCHKYVLAHAKPVGEYVFKSFLFRSPEYLRIRICKGDKNAVITRKSGTHQDAVREEQNETIGLSSLADRIQELESQGFKECTCFKTISHAYEMDGLRIDFNRITYLGSIAEIEAMTEDESDIPYLENKIASMLNKLHLRELEPNIYQKMIDDAHTKGLKPVRQQNFSI